MLDKLKELENKFEDINNQLMDPSVVSDNEKYKKLMKEHKTLSPIVEAYRKLIKAKQDADEAEEMLNAGGLDKEMKELCEEEMQENRKKCEDLTEELKILLLPTIIFPY